MENIPPILRKPIISHPYGSDDFAVVTEYHDTRATGAEAYEPLPKWTPHPDTAKFPDHILVEQKNWDEAGNYVKRVYEILPGPEFTGQKWNPGLGATVNYTEQITKAGEHIGDDSVEITPIDQATQKIHTEVVPTAALGAYHRSFAGTADIRFPDVLQSVTIVFEKSTGDGAGTDTGSALGTTQLSVSLSNSASGSASIMPDAQLKIRQIYGQNLPVVHHFFRLQDPVTRANILTKIAALVGASVTAWPLWKPESHTLTLRGQRASLSGSAHAQQSYTNDGTHENLSEGSGSNLSKEGGVSIHTVYIPPTIHGLITFSPTSDSQDAAVAVSVTVYALGIYRPSKDASASASATAVGSVTPTSLPATSPASIPTTGLYLQDFAVQPDPDYPGWAMVHAILFDMATLA